MTTFIGKKPPEPGVLDDLKAVLVDDDKPKYDLPVAIVAVDSSHNIHLIRIENEDKIDPADPSFLTEEFERDDWTVNAEPGVYRTTITIHGYSCNRPDDPPEYDYDVYFSEFESVEVSKELPGLLTSYRSYLDADQWDDAMRVLKRIEGLVGVK